MNIIESNLIFVIIINLLLYTPEDIFWYWYAKVIKLIDINIFTINRKFIEKKMIHEDIQLIAEELRKNSPEKSIP